MIERSQLFGQAVLIRQVEEFPAIRPPAGRSITLPFGSLAQEMTVLWEATANQEEVIERCKETLLRELLPTLEREFFLGARSKDFPTETTERQLTAPHPFKPWLGRWESEEHHHPLVTSNHVTTHRDSFNGVFAQMHQLGLVPSSWHPAALRYYYADFVAASSATLATMERTARFSSAPGPRAFLELNFLPLGTVLAWEFGALELAVYRPLQFLAIDHDVGHHVALFTTCTPVVAHPGGVLWTTLTKD